jgi:hypothetical protein
LSRFAESAAGNILLQRIFALNNADQEEDDGNHEQDVYKPAQDRKSYESYKPEDYKYCRNGSKHKSSLLVFNKRPGRMEQE